MNAGAGFRVSRSAAALTFLLALVAFAASAVAADRRIDVSSPKVHRLFIPVSQSVTVELNRNLGDMVVADAKIADAQPMTDRVLYVIGKAGGTTTVNLFSEDKRSLGVLEIEVGVDVDDMAQAIRQVAPKSRVTIGSVNGKVRLGGRVKDGATLAAILEVAQQYGPDAVINSVEVEDSQQVNLEVRVLEVSRNAGREVGVSWAYRNHSGSGAGIIGDGVNITDGIVTAGGIFATGNAPFATVIANVLDKGVDVDVIIRALEDKRLARRLAEPNLTALSGETASFLAGGEVPVPVSQDDNTITVEYKEYGVKLNFTPIVLDDSKINLRLNPEVSEVDPTQSIRVDDLELPAFTTRKASTVVELRDGQSFAIAGLLQAHNRKLQSQIPWLSQLPVLGALFRSSSYIKNETDLVIIVTPRLVRPAAPGEQLATPLDKTRPTNDPEYFLLGQLEVTKDMVRAYEQGSGVIGPYGHMLDVRSKDQMTYVKK
ncbi:type II and III secretion system protein family protein [Mesorhizobium sp. KR9-304]|uniref:type II and III secretion system protein family protein n=1 Tax=Mesorhizobium sp. KR9-304 TaxID=3156614 RepID=UPI0032B38894